MRTNKDINSIFLNEKNIIEILLMILTENGDFANYIQDFAESISIRKEEG